MDAVEDVKQRLSVEDVVGEYVELKRAGRNLKGLSPFTSEKTASFIVSPEKQIWHDFSSGKGGDMFTFVMEAEGLDFKGSLELLARKAGLDLDKYSSSTAKKGPSKNRLYEASEAAARFYQVQFSRNQTALAYVFTKRAFTKHTALAWRLGYSPNTGNALVNYLRKQGFVDREIKLAGLATERYQKGLADMFTGRLMIPLNDPQGNVIGFTARLLDDDPKAPKYINTPSTPIYDKSRHVFGLHLAKEPIRKAGFSVLAEGNLDVIASHQAGVLQAVATAGTALTEQQLKTLSRFAGEVRLSFDNDRAGLAAAERAIPIASKVGLSLNIITIPNGKDPDELIRQSAKLWEQVVAKPMYALDWLINRYESQLDITSAEGKRRFSDILLPVVARLSDPVEKDHYLNLLAAKIGVSRTALEQKMHGKDTKPVFKPLKNNSVVNYKMAENIKHQDLFLSLTLHRPELRQFLDILTLDMLYTEPARSLFEKLKANPTDGQMKNLSDYDKILSLEFEELYQGLELTELRYEAARLQARLVEQYVKTEKAKLPAMLASKDGSLRTAALELDKSLNALLKRVQGGANV